jgi:hypothetical protein
MDLRLSIHKLKARTGWIFEGLTWSFRKVLLPRDYFRECPGNLVIGIVTFKDRYRNAFKPLLKKLNYFFPGCRIIVVANGHVMREDQTRYISQITRFCLKFKNVQLTAFTEPKGLSHIWNLIITKSESSRILLLNDDIRVKVKFRDFLLESGIVNSLVATINSSWSHFLISREITEGIGLFDEGFKEVGGEDDDYLARLAIAGVDVKNFSSTTIARRKLPGGRKRINSYGKNMSKERGGYSTANTEYLFSKWETDTRPFPGAVQVPQRNNQYWKLRPGFNLVSPAGKS